jgi:hypothetical protein
MTELEEALAVAGRILERPYADPDDELALLARSLVRSNERAEKLQKFKDWVHGWLDGQDVPADPYPDKTAISGCRISGRLEWMLSRCCYREACAVIEAWQEWCDTEGWDNPSYDPFSAALGRLAATLNMNVK